jgi:RNA polymerase sigma-70 factor (ECF subfamily)
MDDVSTADLVEAVRRGEQDAYASLYAQHVSAVQTVVRSHVHDPAQAEDVVQEVFARALESVPRLTDASRFRPWLLAIARHTAIDTRRRIARSPIATDMEDESTPTAPAVGVDPEELAELAELATLVWGAVAGLSHRDATAMALVSLGFGVPDVAIALGISRGAAKVALHRARERARAALLLDVLARTDVAHCAEFDPAADVVDAARHLRDCAACQGAARRAI